MSMMHLEPIPKERDYADTHQGAMDYARDLSEWMRAYVDATDKHRKENFEVTGKVVAQLEADLLPSGTVRPGWVARDISAVRGELERFVDQVAKDNLALVADNKRTRAWLKWAFTASASALFSLLVFLAGQLILKQG